jgi:biotin carboxylase
MAQPITILCIASYYKGGPFLEECAHQGCHVILVTEQKLEHEAWPRAAIDEFFMMPDLSRQPEIMYAISYLARTRAIDCIIPLDDYDVETAAALREHLQLPGMGSSAARYFRDKLAMRVQTQRSQIPAPEFVHLLNHERVRDYLARVPGPWVLKPRSEASSMGIKKIHSADELWAYANELGDRQSYFLLERFIPGDVYHVDSIVSESQVLFAAVHQYGLPPMTVYHGGGVFVSNTVPYESEEEQALQALNRQVIAALGMARGVTHAEYIRSQDGNSFYFLEIAARVGGAGIDQLMEVATGANPWAEWAKIEIQHLRGEPYRLPSLRREFGGLMVSLARQERPDTSAYNDPEIVWRLEKKHHVGFLAASPDYERVQRLIAEYVPRIAADFTAVEAPLERPPDRANL